MAESIVRLRDYQVEAVEAVERAWDRGVKRPLLTLPTGCGKTIVFAELFRRRAGRGLVLAHREELLEQTRDKIRLVIPNAEVGIVKAERDEHDRPLVVASVQTLSRPERLGRLHRDFLTVTVDEAHHAAAPTYRRVIGQLGGCHPDGPLVLGVTATPERGDHASLGEVWQEVVYRREILEMIRAGHLCDLHAVRVRLEVDLDRVRVCEGDFVESELAEAMSKANAPRHALEAYREHAAGRKTLIFTPTVALAHEMAETFAAAGLAAAAVDGETPVEERREILAAFSARELRVVANCALMTEGYDEPSVDCLILARPTRSRPFYVQMLGRGTRRFPGKADCLVIDLVGASRRHRLVTVAELFGLDPDKVTAGESVLDTLDGAVESGVPEGDGRLVAEVVDLFAEREMHWSCGEGLYVLSAGRRGQVVLREEAGRWTVSALPAGGGLEATAADLDLGYAQRGLRPAERCLDGGGLRAGHTEAALRPAAAGCRVAQGPDERAGKPAHRSRHGRREAEMKRARAVSVLGADSDPAAGCPPGEVRIVALESLTPCPVQPRVNPSMRLIDQLAASMEAGRHRPLLEVEPLPEEPGLYEIVCGEQRWRAARQAGLSEVLVRVLPRLSYLDRLRKQLEENRLRAALDPVEEAYAILKFRTLLQVERAEELLGQAGVAFQALDSKRISDREVFQRHLEELKRLLVETGTHVVRSGEGPVCGPLSPWRETERALSISEASRKQKVGILRLPPELQEEVRELPAEHAIQISRLDDAERQTALVERAPALTHRQVRTAVDRLRRGPELTVHRALQEEGTAGEDGGPLGFDGQLLALADLCRQLARRLGYLRARLTAEQRQ